MNFKYEGYEGACLTLEADETLETGMAVTIKEDGKAYPCGENDPFCGYAVNMRTHYCAVQFSGFVRMKAEGDVKPGMKKLSVNSEGKITENENGRECVVFCAYGDGTIGFIF